MRRAGLGADGTDRSKSKTHSPPPRPLAWGRGTPMGWRGKLPRANSPKVSSTRRRVACGGGDNGDHYSVETVPHVRGRDAKHCHALFERPPIATQVVSGLIRMGVSCTVHFDGQLAGRAVEIENIGAHGMLTPEAKPAKRLAAKNSPKPKLRWRHCPAQSSRPFECQGRRCHPTGSSRGNFPLHPFGVPLPHEEAWGRRVSLRIFGF